MAKKDKSPGSYKWARGINRMFEATVGTAMKKAPKGRSVHIKSVPLFGVK